MLESFMAKLNLLLILFTFQMAAFAQKKAKNDDLRKGKSIFWLKKGEQSLGELRQGGLGDYTLYFEGARWKLSTQEAEKVEGDFLETFFQLKYSMAQSKEKKCDSSYKLFIRGDEYEACEIDKPKKEKLLSFIKLVKDSIDKRK